MYLKSAGYMDSVLFPTISKEGDVLLPYVGKWDIYCRNVQVSQQPISIFIGNPDKNLLPTYQNFYADIYLAY
jgi:hypothetical protein